MTLEGLSLILLVVLLVVVPLQPHRAEIANGPIVTNLVPNLIEESMNRTRTGVSVAVKRAVSVPKGLDEAVQRICKNTHQPYSVVVQVALRKFLAVISDAQLEQEFREYYNRAEVRHAEERLAADMLSISKESWPA